MIAVCSCKSIQQDKLYGVGKRVHNICKRPGTKELNGGKRCTVCGKVTPV